MMGVDAIATSSGKYNISIPEAYMRTGLANAPIFAAGVYIGAKVKPVVMAYVTASQYAELIKKGGNILQASRGIADGLFAVKLAPSFEIKDGIYVEERFLVRYGGGLIHSIGVITQLNENDALESSISISSVSPASWGAPWNQRVDYFKKSMPYSTV